MAREQSIEELVAQAADRVVAEASDAIAQAIARMASERIQQGIKGKLAQGGVARPQLPAMRPPRPKQPGPGELTRWSADRRARRVPNFVIEMTGLKTKKAIVEKYGPGATFEIGQPLPPVNR